MARRKNSIKNKFNMFLNINIIADVLLAIFGLFLIIVPMKTMSTVGIIIGIILIFHAAALIYTYISRNGAKLYSLNMIFGLLIAILGIALIINPSSLENFVTICLGLFLLVNGASKLNYGLWLRKGKEETWTLSLATGIMFIMLSIVLIFNIIPNLTTTIIGGILLCIAAANLMDTFLFKKRSNEIIKIFW